jgi:hypothetical protein
VLLLAIRRRHCRVTTRSERTFEPRLQLFTADAAVVVVIVLDINLLHLVRNPQPVRGELRVGFG